MLLFLVLLFVKSFGFLGLPPLHNTDCSFTREDSYQCLKRFVDVNPKDDQITRTEAEEAISKYMPFYVKAIMYWVGVDGAFETCDYDKNNVITRHDWDMTNATCIPIKESWCSVEWFCTRAIDQESKRRKPRK